MAKAATNKPKILVMALSDLSPMALEIFVPNVKRTTTIMKIVIRDASTSMIAYKPD